MRAQFFDVPDECIVASVNQIGPKQIGSVDGPLTYPIKRLTGENEIVAEDSALCSRITIILDTEPLRKIGSVLDQSPRTDQTDKAESLAAKAIIGFPASCQVCA